MLGRNLRGLRVSRCSQKGPNTFARELNKKKQTQKPPVRKGWKPFQQLVLLAGPEAQMPPQTQDEITPPDVMESSSSSRERCQEEKFQRVAGNPVLSSSFKSPV